MAADLPSVPILTGHTITERADKTNRTDTTTEPERKDAWAWAHAEEWLLPLAMACDLESESSVSYQSPLALSRCVCDLS